MSQITIPQNDPILAEVLAAYEFPATLLGAVRYGQGHINDTFCVLCQPRDGDCVRFILQGLSSEAFPHPEELMENSSASPPTSGKSSPSRGAIPCGRL